MKVSKKELYEQHVETIVISWMFLWLPVEDLTSMWLWQVLWWKGLVLYALVILRQWWINHVTTSTPRLLVWSPWPLKTQIISRQIEWGETAVWWKFKLALKKKQKFGCFDDVLLGFIIFCWHPVVAMVLSANGRSQTTCHTESVIPNLLFSIINPRLSELFESRSWTLHLTDLFRAAAEAGPHHILKMYNTNGSVVNISPRLEANSEDSYYRLEVVASDLKSERPPLTST